MSNPKLGNACNITTGKLDSNQAVDGGDYPFYTCSEEPVRIDSYAFNDDVVLVAGNNAQGNFHVNRFKGKFNAYQRTYVLTAKPDYDIDFIYYTLKLKLKKLKERSQGSQTKFLTMPILTNINLRDIDKVEQQRISSILSSIDKKIEKNKQINQELENMAKIIFDYWFVQFDFPDKNGKPYKSSGGKMIWNEKLKREIPEGWDVEKVGELLSKEKLPRKIPSLQYLDIGKFPIIDQSTQFIAGFTNYPECIINTNEPRIIFGDHTRVLKLINFDFARGADGTQILHSNSERLPQYLFYHTLSKIDLSNYGYARHFKFLKDVKVILPDTSNAIKFEDLSNKYYQSIKKNIFENKQLSDLRDFLLPMLMNGQVTVV
jgi:type I restriction enzyme, S subunit